MMTQQATEPVKIEKFNRVSTGISGRDTNWQGKPPRYAVFMVETQKGWTTLKVYDLTDKVTRKQDIIISESPMRPNDTSFSHDVDYDDLPRTIQHEIRIRIIENLRVD